MAGFVVSAVALYGLLAVLWLGMERRLRRQGYDRKRKPPASKPAHRFDPEVATSFRGGSRVGSWNVTVPLVSLRVDREYAHLSGLAPVWIPRAQVDGVHRIKSALGSGLRFSSTSGDFDGVIFWTFRPEQVLGAFRRLGWPVPPAPTR